MDNKTEQIIRTVKPYANNLYAAASKLAQDEKTVYGVLADRDAAFCLALGVTVARQFSSVSQSTLDGTNWREVAAHFGWPQ